MPIPSSKRETLKRKILVRVAPIAFLLFYLTSYLTLNSIYAKFSNQIEARAKEGTVHFAKIASSRIEEAANANSAIAQNHLVINGIVDVEHRDSTLQPFFRSLMLPGPPDQIAMMTDYRGKPLVTNQRAVLDTSDSENLVLRQINDLRPVWAPTVLDLGRKFVGTDSGNLVIASPVLYSGQPEGAVVSIYSLATFFEEILETSQMTVTGIEYQGQIIASADHAILETHKLCVAPRGWKSSKQSIARLDDVNAVFIASDKTTSSATNAVLMAMGAHFLICSLGVLVAIWAATHMVTRPLADIAKRIRRIQETADLTMRVNGSDLVEFERLASAFNQLLAELNKTTVSKETYRKLALVAKYTDNAVIITDAEGRIEWVNDGFTRTTGYKLHEVVGKTPGSFLQGSDTDKETIVEMRQAILQYRGFDVEIVNYKRNGQPYWVAIETRPIMNEAGVVEKFIAIEADITERKRSEAEKAALAKELQDSARTAGMAEIATGVLHNVGNVLNSINVSANLLVQNCQQSQIKALVQTSELLDSKGDQLGDFLTHDQHGKNFPNFFKLLVQSLVDEQNDNLKELSTLGDHVNHVKETIAFQQSYAKQGGVVEPVNLAETMESVLRMNLESFESFGIEIERDFDRRLVVNVNKHKLLQILINLITNAKHALRDAEDIKRQLKVQITSRGPQVAISVKDNGVGISAENLEKVFVHGFTTKDDGHGFGLHSSALAAQEMGGALTVDSQGKGRGATFELTIAREIDQPIPITKLETTAVGQPMTESAR